MKIFVSWSGRRSRDVADALCGWLKGVIQTTEPWMSTDMERGVKWLGEIGRSLDSHSLGILCVTPGNASAPWLNFEAGALSKQLEGEGRVIPYLLDFHSESDLKEPLAQFNACLATEAGTWSLVRTLNAHSEYPQDDQGLSKTFEKWWPDLEHQLESIRTSGSGQPSPRRDIGDKVDEVLELTRRLIQAQETGSTRGPSPTSTGWRPPPLLGGSPYGEGSYIGSDPPLQCFIKGNESLMKYFLPASAGYERLTTEVWFESEEAAQAAGFIRARG